MPSDQRAADVDVTTTPFSDAIHTQVDINAERESVWAVLADTAAYPEWNPFVRRLDGTPDVVGSTLQVTLELAGRNPQRLSPTVTASEPGRRFAWRGRTFVPGLLDADHVFELVGTSSGTRLVHRERLRGVAVPAGRKLLAVETPARSWP